MTSTELEEKLAFELQTQTISEIADGDVWTEDGVINMDDAELAEITAGDDKPFYVEFVALYEDMSGNGKIYGKSAVKSCVDAMVGVNMYKGHVEPGTQDWKYREPVGRIVAAREQTISLPDGSKVLAAKGKAYITDGDAKLRSDIKKKMAGSVSILGNARMVRRIGETTKTVTHLHKPLKSVDFCNPGTGGLSHAGVTAVVSEMQGTVEAANPDSKHEEPEMKTRLTKDELLAEYKPEITALVGEQIEEQIQEIASGRREVATQKEEFKDEKTALEGTVSEMTTARDTAVTEAADWKAKYEAERDLRIQADVVVFANEHVAEMKGLDGANEKLIDMAAKRAESTVVEGDLDKSKAAYTAAFKGALEEVTELAEMFGGDGDAADVSEKPTRKHKKNGKKGGDDVMNRVLSPAIVKARAARAGV